VDKQQLKDRVIARVDALQDRLWEISTAIHAHPELSFQEHRSAALLISALTEMGFRVERGIGNLETAFRATRRSRSDGPTIALLAEYDALPEIGHACGHNLIGTAAIGAGMALLAVLDKLPGGVQIIGTPAEEGGCGKGILVEAGVFDGIAAAMMFHPSTRTMVGRGSLAAITLNLEFHGKAAHAAASPDKGVNALEACLLTFNNINALRQHFRPDARVAGIITHGGKAANVIPDYAAAKFIVRGATSSYRDEVLARVIACAEAGAQATGARLEHSTGRGYDHMIPNTVLNRLFAENLEALGLKVQPVRPDEPMGSTDMGNVSHVVPAIHPYIAIAPEGVAGHSIEFREAAVSPAGREAMLNAAKAMAMTAVDLLSEPNLLALARKAWEEAR